MRQRMSYTDKSGVNHPLSYWRVWRRSFVYDQGAFVMAGYHNLAEMKRNAEPIATKKYIVSKEGFAQYFHADVIAAEGMNEDKACHLFSKAKKTELKPGYKEWLDLDRNTILVREGTEPDYASGLVTEEDVEAIKVTEDEAMESFFVTSVLDD